MNHNITYNNDIKVELVYSSPLEIAVSACRLCKQSKIHPDTKGNDISSQDHELLCRIIRDGHESILEHIVYTFFMQDITRLCLQELVRHRIASYSVVSTRYTIKKLLSKEESFISKNRDTIVHDYTRASKYIVLTEELKNEQVEQLEKLRYAVAEKGLSNDQLKYVVPESFKTSLYMTINCRSLRNFLRLRTNRSAHNEIRQLAFEMHNSLPVQHKFLYLDVLSYE